VASPEARREAFDCRGAELVVLHGELDIATTEMAHDMIAWALGAHCAIVDLSEVEFMDASGVGLFLSTLKEATLTGRHLMLCGPAPAVRRVFTALDLEDAFAIYDDVASAAAVHPLREISSPTGPQRPWGGD
jgi:anti-sigma B factor antagonist